MNIKFVKLLSSNNLNSIIKNQINVILRMSKSKAKYFAFIKNKATITFFFDI